MTKKEAEKTAIDGELDAMREEYGKAIEFKKAVLQKANELEADGNYIPAAELYSKIGNKKGIIACVNGLIKDENYIAAGEILGYVNPKKAKQYIKDLSEHDGGKYVAEAGIVAASMGYERIANGYAKQAAERRDFKGAKAVYDILDSRREIRKEKPQSEEQAKAA